MKLEDLVENDSEVDVQSAIKTLAEHLRSQEDENGKKFLATQELIAKGLDSMCSILSKILERPDPTFPEVKEFPDSMKVTMDAPAWYIPPVEPSNEWIPNLTNSIRYDGDQTRKVLQQILEKLNEEKDEEDAEEKPIEPIKTVNTAAVRSRRTTQWKRFDNYDLKNITAGGDGVTFYLPDSLIPNSETVRLNGGVPLLNTDYTLTGNRLFFTNGDQSQSTIEIRGQIK